MVRAGCAVKVELSEGADRLAVAVRGRGVGALREVTANIPEGSGGASRKELPGVLPAGPEGLQQETGTRNPEILVSREERRCLKPTCWWRDPWGFSVRTEKRPETSRVGRGRRASQEGTWGAGQGRADLDKKVFQKTWGSARSTHQAEQQDGATRDRRSCPPGGLQRPTQGRRWPQRMSDPGMTVGALSGLLHLGKVQGKWGGGVPKGGTRNSWQRRVGVPDARHSERRGQQ